VSSAIEVAASKKRKAYARHLAATGIEQYSAERAGYSWESEHWRLRNDPRIAEMVAVERARLFNVELAGMAYATMQAILEPGAKVPPAVKYQAARYVLEACGHHKQEVAAPLDMDKPLSDMTLSELGQFIKQGEETLSQMRTIEHNPQANTEAPTVMRLEVADLLA
jgi:hypothetical protein